MDYSHQRKITCEQFVDVLNRSTLGERRPVEDGGRIASMLEHASLLCTAWDDHLLVGVARSVTDFSYCCYLSDLAVDTAYQGRGIGVELIRVTQRQLHPQCKVILLAAPKAEGYYPKIGMVQHRSAWTTACLTLARRQSVASVRMSSASSFWKTFFFSVMSRRQCPRPLDQAFVEPGDQWDARSVGSRPTVPAPRRKIQPVRPFVRRPSNARKIPDHD